jgi:hypothetical protein
MGMMNIEATLRKTLDYTSESLPNYSLFSTFTNIYILLHDDQRPILEDERFISISEIKNKK